METTADPGSPFSQQCSSCDGSSARCWCLDCKEALCDVCVSAHRRVTLTRSHRILNQPPAGDVSTPPTKFCRLHPSEPLKLFCFTCNQLTCRDCQLMAHMNHRYQFVSEALASLKKQLEVSVQPIRAHGGTARQSLLDMETRLQDLVECESNLQAELLQSYNVVAQHLKKRMEDILKEVKKVCELECEAIQRRMRKLKQLQQNQHSVTETAQKAKTTNDLSALLTYTAQIESQLKGLPDQDLSPPQTMSQLKVITDKKSLEALLNFGELQVSWIPFSVSQTSNQNRDTPAASPLTPTCPAPSYRPLPQTRTTSDTDSPVPAVPVSCSSASSKSSSSHLSPLSSSSVSQFGAPGSTGVTCRVQRVSTSVNLPSSTVLQLVQLTAPHQNQPVSVLLNNSQTAYQVSRWPSRLPSVPQLPMLLGQTVTYTVPGNTCRNQQNTCGGHQILPVAATGNQTTTGHTAAPVPDDPRATSWKSSSHQLCPPPSSTPFTASSSTSPPPSSCSAPPCELLPKTRTIKDPNSPAPDNHLASSWKSSSNQLCLPPSSSCSLSSAVTPPTTTCPAPTCRPLPHTENTNDAASPVPHNHLTTSRKTLSDRLCPSPSSSSSSSSSYTVTPLASTCLSPSCRTLPQTGNTCDTDSPDPVKCPSTSRKSSSSHLSPPLSSGPSVSQFSAPVTTAVTCPQTAERASSSPTNQEPLKDTSCTALSSPEGPTPDPGPPSSPLKHQQQSAVVRAVADSACDRSVRQVAARQQEPAENEPTSTVCEEAEPAGKPSPPDVSDGDAEKPSSVIGHPDYSLDQWQPTVSLFRLPVSPPRPGRPLPGFRLVPGEAKDEIYLEEMSEDTQSHADDITEPVSSPESPLTLQVVTCSACGSANGSIICLACGRGYHRDCHVPPVAPDIWSEWTCSLCQDLSDPSDPYSSDRPPRPPSPCLSLLDQRRCESLLLYLMVEGCQKLSEFGVWSDVQLMSERLTLRRSPAYQTAAELLSDIWSLFNDASQDDEVLNKLQEKFQSREIETFSSELRPPSGRRDTEGGGSAANHNLSHTKTPPGGEVVEGLKGSKVTSEQQEAITCQAKLKKTRKRLREFLDLVGTPGSKRTKTDRMDL